MDRVLVVGRKHLVSEVLESLQALGVVHVDPLEPPQELQRLKLTAAERPLKEGWSAAVNRAEGLTDALGLQQVEPAAHVDAADLEEVSGYLGDVGDQVDRLVAERGETRDDLELIEAYLPLFRELAPNLAQLERSHYLYGVAFIVSADTFEEVRRALEEGLEGHLVLATRPLAKSKSLAVTAAFLKRDRQTFAGLLNKLGLSELHLPERYHELGVAKAVHVMEERQQNYPQRLRTIHAELGKLAEAHGPKIRALEQLASNYQRRYDTMLDLATGRYSFALQGWAPRNAVAHVTAALKEQFGDAVIVETRPADEIHDENVPVKLDNPGWMKPFEPLLALFPPPKYGTMDPTWSLATLFPLYFGLIVGDMGYGLVYLALGLWFRMRARGGKRLAGIGRQGLTMLSNATLICAGLTIIFGFIYGEFFGDFLMRLHVFYISGQGHGLIPILLPRIEVYQPLITFSLAAGVAQVLGGWAIRVYYARRHREPRHFWEAIGYLGGLIAFILWAWAYYHGFSTIFYILIILSFALFAFGMIRARVYLGPIELISNGSNILSFLRIIAFALAAAIIAELVTDFGFTIGGVLPIIGPILGILVAIVLHIFAIILALIDSILQPLRLQYVEFFTKFGYYDESGRSYNPLRLLGGKA